MNTIKKTDLYDHKNPPRAEKEPENGMLCPMSRKECLTERCMLWDEDYHVCAMSPVSLYNQVRDALTDAVVELKRAYGDDLK